ncbi:MAG: endopeptidase La, partial [Pseudomonadota bacterium]|nr:endopeptidase La [Pseudomonadota bacterium]
LKLINELPTNSKHIVVVAQEDGSIEDPEPDEMYSFGTLAVVLKVFDMPDNSKSAIVQGIDRVKILEFKEKDPYYRAVVQRMTDSSSTDDLEIDALANNLRQVFSELIQVAPNLSEEHSGMLSNIQKPARLADRAVSLLTVSNPEKQDVLEELDIKIRVEKSINILTKEIQRIQLGEEIQTEVHDEISKSQREYYLREQMKAIKRELGEDESQVELKEIEDAIKEAKMPEEAEKVALKELDRLSKIPSQSPEYTVSRTYLDWLTELPWSTSSSDTIDVAEAKKILDEDHYGLEKVKERILEYLAVRALKKQKDPEGALRGPLLCFAGPPGVGKTSLGKSIARSTNRVFTRMSLGGVRDEAEIRGHRRTYIGSMPGKIIQNLSKSKTRNPLFLLDEIDKMAMDFRGDPSSALLEVLDPEQNSTFSDHYLEVDYDLSNVMFVCTANTLDIPSPLLDRMEVIRLSGYTEDEKFNIATKFLIPKQFRENGLEHIELEITKCALMEIIQRYTREAGVRHLERAISKICRKVVRKILQKPSKRKIKVTKKNLPSYLGVYKYKNRSAENDNQVGQVNGLAWTQVGGEILTIESAIVPGKGKLIHTGQLGSVMTESIHAAMTVARSRSSSLQLDKDFYKKFDLHVHVPEGATPKDGPSAGVGMCTAIISALTNIPIRSDIAMTGEITLRGEVLAIGGLKEKLLAAHRGGIKTVLIPHENEKDLKEIPNNIKDKLDILPVKWIDEILKKALIHFPVSLSENKEKNETKATLKNIKNTSDSIRPH